MLFLLFQIGGERYALDTSGVLEVVPCVPLKRLAGAPAGVAGWLDYHASPVPVLDLHALATGQPAAESFSRRLILLKVPESAAHAPGPRTVALLAERATGTLRRDEADFRPTGLEPAAAPHLGAVTADAEGFIRRVHLEGLLAGPVRSLLHSPAPTPARAAAGSFLEDRPA